MLHRVGYVKQRPVNSSIYQRPIQQLAGWPHERMSLSIFLVPRLFADQNDVGGFRPFAEHGLRRMSVEIASPAFLHCFPKSAQSRLFRNIVGCAVAGFCSWHGPLKISPASFGPIQPSLKLTSPELV
jgi:hypothetical protein